MGTERCVQIHSTPFNYALTLVYLADPLFWMHHAVSVCLDVTVGTDVAVLANR
jgi:hypothetical protein